MDINSSCGTISGASDGSQKFSSRVVHNGGFFPPPTVDSSSSDSEDECSSGGGEVCEVDGGEVLLESTIEDGLVHDLRLSSRWKGSKRKPGREPENGRRVAANGEEASAGVVRQASSCDNKGSPTCSRTCDNKNTNKGCDIDAALRAAFHMGMVQFGPTSNEKFKNAENKLLRREKDEQRKEAEKEKREEDEFRRREKNEQEAEAERLKKEAEKEKREGDIQERREEKENNNTHQARRLKRPSRPRSVRRRTNFVTMSMNNVAEISHENQEAQQEAQQQPRQEQSEPKEAGGSQVGCL